jgi:hypothetical protein
VAAVAVEKAERKAERAAQRAARRSESPILTDAKIDRSEAARLTGQTDRSEKRSESPILTGSPDRSIDRANDARRATREQAITDLLSFLASNPGASYRLAGDAVGRSKPWAVAALGDLEASGKVRRNGHGWEVLS